MSVALPIIEPSPDFISELLREQQSLTAVERFSSLHDRGALVESTEPAQAKYYRSLLPASPPGPGQQFAFQVDLDKCSGCKACVVACHTMNGLEEDEAWRRVGTVLTITQHTDNQHAGIQQAGIQHVTTACHHCVDPGCLNGCPVKAYDKDPQTGIVRHLDDQCIGCKYCTMMCPYEVPKYNERLGIVRKCDMCHQRLSKGEAPACVQACPNEAIAITVVSSQAVPAAESRLAPRHRLAPGAPLSHITQPTTVFHTSRESVFSSSVPQDFEIDEVAESHWPLAVLLVTTQASVGLLALERLYALTAWAIGNSWPSSLSLAAGMIALLVAGIGMNLGALHLGQPLRAWRVFLGLRTSWLSREAVVLGKYVGFLASAVSILLLNDYRHMFPQMLVEVSEKWLPAWLPSAMMSVALVAGAIGLYCSAMIYVATRRVLWRSSRTFAAFGGSTLIGGLALFVPVLLWFESSTFAIALATAALSIVGAVKLAWEFRLRAATSMFGDAYDSRSRRLLSGPLKRWSAWRFRLTLVGLVLFAITIAMGSSQAPMLAFSLSCFAALLLIGGELTERLIYFSSVVYDRMPGTMR